MVYARRLVELVCDYFDEVYLVFSENAPGIIESELGIEDAKVIVPEGKEKKVIVLNNRDLFAPPASGSHRYAGVVCVPCSMGTVGRVAGGVSDDLITRVCDVALKERRKLVFVVRETPYNLVHLRNMTALCESGAIILPASPAFYSGVESIDDAVDFVVDRVLRQFGIDAKIGKGWKETDDV